MLLGFASVDASSSPGGKLTPAWKWKPTLPGGFVLAEPRWATPVIDATLGVMYALLKWEGDAQLYALQLNGGNEPTPLWTLDLGKVIDINTNGNVAIFKTWNQEHAIFFYGGRVWVPSNDFDGALIVDPSTVTSGQPTYIVTEGQWSDNHRLYGSVASRGDRWTKPVRGGVGWGGRRVFVCPHPPSSQVFLVHGSRYGIQQYDPLTGNVTAAYTRFEPDSYEFSHPVAVRFAGYSRDGPYRFDCIIATEFDPAGGLYIAAAESTNMTQCGSWSANGYYVRSKAFALPRWVSAPAVLYNSEGTVTLYFSVQLNNGNLPDGYPRRSAWRTAVVAVQIDQSGPYLYDLDFFLAAGVRANAAPLAIRDAWGVGRHAIAVGASDGGLYLFRAGNIARGPYLDHALAPLLVSTNPLKSNADAGISGNYMAANEAGSVAFVMHNGTRGSAQEFWFGIVTGVMYPLPTDVTPSPSPSVSAAPGSAPSPQPISNAPVPKVDVAAAVFGTLGGLAFAAIAIVVFLPTAGFMMGGSKVVPADMIKGAASATWGSINAAGRGVASLVSGGGGSRSLPTTAVYTSASSTSEGASLLRSAGKQ